MAHASMGVRVGTDIQPVSVVADALARYGDRYARRLFTTEEIIAAGGVRSAAAPRLAARFAAKEAVLKLLSPTDVVPPWRSIEIETAANGAPSVRLTGEAAALAESLGVDEVALSMTHDAGIAAATVVALTHDEGQHNG
jgi:holo-[acyl-carrier protein] synthase